jgi:transcription elongation factor GreA
LEGWIIVAKEYKITSARLKELEAELNYLKTTREKEVAELIKEARSFGDLSENSEYDEAKNEQAKLYGRIAEVENILANAVIIEEGEENTGKVGLGCRVRVLDIEMEEEEEYTIVGSQEADPMNGRISDESPMGRALVGHVVGDKVEVEAPMGKLHFEIIAIEN